MVPFSIAAIRILHIFVALAERTPQQVHGPVSRLLGELRVLAGGRRRLHGALERGVILLNFFVRTVFLLNRLRCTATLAAFQVGEEEGSRRGGFQGVAALINSRRSVPDLNITEIGDIRADDGE